MVTFGLLPMDEHRMGIGIYIPGTGESEGAVCTILVGHDLLKKCPGRQTVALAEYVNDLPFDGQGKAIPCGSAQALND